jgi:hypothetical protein
VSPTKRTMLQTPKLALESEHNVRRAPAVGEIFSAARRASLRAKIVSNHDDR